MGTTKPSWLARYNGAPPRISLSWSSVVMRSSGYSWRIPSEWYSSGSASHGLRSSFSASMRAPEPKKAASTTSRGSGPLIS